MKCKTCGAELFKESIETGEFGKYAVVWLCPNCNFNYHSKLKCE